MSIGDEDQLKKENALLGSYEWDLPANKLEWSPEMFQIFGLDETCTPAFALIRELAPPEDKAILDGAMQDILAQRPPASIIFRIVRPDGEERFVHSMGRPEYDEAGHLARMAGTVQDVTASRRAEQALQEHEARLNTIIENAGGTIWALDAGCHRTAANAMYLCSHISKAITVNSPLTR